MSSVLPKFDKGSESKLPIVNCDGHQVNNSTSHGNTTISANAPSTSTNSSSSFYRGVSSSQQPIFSPIIATQNQNYYNGVYCSQAGYANSASLPSPNFSGFSYDSAPWTHEGHLSMHSSTLSAENIRNLAAPLSEKGVLNYSNASHTCYLNKLASGEGISLGSPLTSSVYKSSGKEIEQHNKIGINSDPQLCFMNLSQQTQNSTLSMYKCSEQVSPSSLSQMNLFSIESYDFKYSSDMPSLPSNVNDVVQKNSRSPANVAKQVPSKYCHTPRMSSGESQGYDQSPILDFKQQEQCAYPTQTTNYSTESHLETYYLQGPFSFNVDTSQNHYPPQRHANGHEESIYLSSKTYPSPSLDGQVGIGARSLCHSDRPRGLLDSNISADLVRLESYLHVDSKHVVSPCSQDGFHSGKQFEHDFQQPNFPSVPHHMVGSQFPQLSNCIQLTDGLKLNNRPSNGDNIDCEILESVNGKDIDVLESEDSSSQESLSIAEEDDIIVEEEIEEPKEKKIVEEEGVDKAISPSVKDCLKRCLVCDSYHIPSLQAFILIPLKADSPVTSVSYLPVAAKLSHILLQKNRSMEEDNVKDNDVQVQKNFHGEYLCGRCLSLVERADDLEVKLGVIYQDLQCLYKRTTLKKGNTNNVNTEVCEPAEKAANPVLYSLKNDGAKRDERLQRDDHESIVILSDTDPQNENHIRKNTEELNDSTIESFDLNGNIKTRTLPEIDTDEKNIKEDEKEEVENTIILEKLQSDMAQSEAKNLENNKQKERLEEKKFVCDVCDMKFSRKESMVKHMQLHTGDFSFRCEHCKKGFSRHGALARHIISRHNGDKDRHNFQCEQCGKRFTQEHHLQVHLQSHRGELPHICEQCGKGFASQYSLSIHKRTHSGERPFPCKHCGRSFTTCSNLKAHTTICPKNCLAKEPKPRKPLNHYCSYCKKGFAKPSDLKVHLRSHTGEKPYVCERCGKRFCNSGNYNQHARSHCNAVSLAEGEEQKEDDVVEVSENGEQGLSSPNIKLEKSRPFKCKVCYKGFPRKGALTAHENRHKGIKPFVCDTCGKAFPDRSNLHNHKILHSSVKPHRCDVCGKSIRSSLKVHMRTHTGEKPYSCSICKQKFAVNSSLTVHLRKHHEIDSSRSQSP